MLYLVGFSAGLQKSTDGGGTWVSIFNADSVDLVAIDPVNPDTLYVGTYHNNPLRFPTPGPVMKSVDGGQSWHRSTSSAPPS